MIRKLRAKLILASMLSLLLVLAVIFVVVGVLNYRKIVSDADSILGILKANDGSFPIEERQEAPFSSDGYNRTNRRFSPELPYESRYFTVSLTQEGVILTVNTGKIAAVDTETAIDYAQQVFREGSAQGFLGDYRYTAYAVGTEWHIVFLDYGRELSAFRTFLFTSIGVGLAGLLAVLLLLVVLSGRIMKPFAENYEKQKQFITDAGHELKTPLTIIDADAEVLEMDIGENEWLKDIQAHSKRLAQLTNNLILLSRMEEQPQMAAIEFPLSDLAEETLETFQALARTNHKALSGHIEPMLSMTGDEKAIGQLLTILLDNVIKYSDEGGRIELALKKQKNTLCLSVFNTSENISKESLAHLFDRFYRADKSRNSKSGGYGLGLSIASAIVSAHKGRISAATQDGKSLTISVTFPA